MRDAGSALIIERSPSVPGARAPAIPVGVETDGPLRHPRACESERVRPPREKPGDRDAEAGMRAGLAGGSAQNKPDTGLTRCVSISAGWYQNPPPWGNT